MGRSHRTRLFAGVYKDRAGVSVVVSIKGKPREFRKDAQGKPYSSYERHALKDEPIRVKARELQITERAEIHDQTFEKDVQRFLNTISSDGHRLNTQGYMAHWLKHFADRERNAITDVDAQTAFAAIKQANSTKIHIRRALIQFYDTLNGKSGYNPGRSLRKPARDDEKVRDLPWPLIDKLFAALPASRAKARLMLIAYVGLPQKQIAKLQPSDLRLASRELVVHPRRKGAGVAGQVQPLSDVAIAALKEFQRVNAFGSFQNRQLVETFRSGARKAGITLPEGARPYDLRHSFLTELARSGADIRDIAQLGMHATLEQAARYMKGAAQERSTKVIASVPRFRAMAQPAKTPKQSRSLQRNGGRPHRQTAQSKRQKRSNY